MSHSVNRGVLQLLVCGLSVVGCTRQRPSEISIDPIVSRNPDGRVVMTLPLSLTAIAALAHKPDLVSDLDVGGSTPAFGAIADVRGDTGGGFWVLDRLEKELIRFDSAGTIGRRFGRRGEGPGEFHDPWAFLVMNDAIVVWQNHTLQTFQTFTPDGEFVASRNRPVPGDWRALMFRDPTVLFDGYQFGPEDITSRFLRATDSTFVIGLQEDEMHAAAEGHHVELRSPPLRFMRFDKHQTLLDTLAILRGADLERGSVRAGFLPLFVQRLFVRRPFLAFGTGWSAYAHGDSAEVRVLTDTTTMTIQWPVEERPITRDDVAAAVDWVIADARNKSEDFDKQWRSMSRGTRGKLRHREAARLMPATNAPQIMAARGSGRCLWLSGFSARDSWNGVSRTWLVIDIPQAKVLETVRLPRGERLRDAKARWAFTTYKDTNDAWHVKRYELPFGCE